MICFAAGMSRWRLVSPAVKLATLAVVLTLATNLWVQPWAAREMRQELFRIRTDLAAALVKRGRVHPADPGPDHLCPAGRAGRRDAQRVHLPGDAGRRDRPPIPPGAASSPSATAEPVLVMQDGSNQGFNSAGVLNYLAFDEYTLELGALPEERRHPPLQDGGPLPARAGLPRPDPGVGAAQPQADAGRGPLPAGLAALQLRLHDAGPVGGAGRLVQPAGLWTSGWRGRR